MNKKANKVTYRWFEMKIDTYLTKKYKHFIYLYYKDNKYADISINTKNGEVVYNYELYEDFSDMFSFDFEYFDNVMCEFIKNKFNLKKASLLDQDEFTHINLKIPS